MRVLSVALLSALALPLAAAPAFAQQQYETDALPGVRVTIQPRSYLDPGTQVRPATARDYERSNLTGNSFRSWNYEGVPGFSQYPLHDPLDLPDNRMIYVLRAPDRVR